MTGKTPKPPLKVPFDRDGNMQPSEGYYSASGGGQAVLGDIPDLTDAVLEVLGFLRGRSSLVVRVRVFPKEGPPFKANMATQDFFEVVKGLQVKGTFKPTKRGTRYALAADGPVYVSHQRKVPDEF